MHVDLPETFKMEKIILLLLVLSTRMLDVFATPTPGGWGNWAGHKCISDAQAAVFVENIESLYHCMDAALAEKVLTPDFVSYSYTLLRTPGVPFEVRELTSFL